MEELGRRRRQLSVQHEYGGLTDDELKRRLAGINQEQRDAERSLKNLDGDTLYPPTDPAQLIGGPERSESAQPILRESSWALDPELLQKQVNEIQLSTMLDTAILGASAREDKEAVRKLDELAEALGLRVTVGSDGGLTVQFGVPLTPSMGSSTSEAPDMPIVSRPS